MILSDIQHRIKDRLQQGEYFTTPPLVNIECLDGSLDSPMHALLLSTFMNAEGCLVVVENVSLSNQTWDRDEIACSLRVYENPTQNREGGSGTRKHPRDVAWQIKLMLHGYVDPDQADLKFRVTSISPEQNSDGLNEWIVQLTSGLSTRPETET